MSDLTEFLLARLDDDEREMAEAIQQRHGGRWTLRRDPSRFAADVQAKRAIVGMYTNVQMGEGWDGEPAVLGGAEPETYYETLQHLATVYADHPDYDEAWRP
jgi:hypothetical protein